MNHAKDGNLQVTVSESKDQLPPAISPFNTLAARTRQGGPSAMGLGCAVSTGKK